MPGTGGGMSIRIGSGIADNPIVIFSTPSGIQKEDMVGDDVFKQDMDQNVITPPIMPGLKLRYCIVIFEEEWIKLNCFLSMIWTTL